MRLKTTSAESRQQSSDPGELHMALMEVFTGFVLDTGKTYTATIKELVQWSIRRTEEFYHGEQ